MKHPSTLGPVLLLLIGGSLLNVPSLFVVSAERIRGAASSSSSSSLPDSASTARQRRQQIRKLKRRGEPVKYARLLVDEEEEYYEEGDESQDQHRRRLPPSKVSKACSSKSLKASKEGSGKAGKGSKSQTDNRPSCDTERSFCSCPACTQEVLDRMAGEYTCGARMEYLLTHNSGAFAKTRQACGRVGGLEFPKECGECDPATCTGRQREEPKFYCGCRTCDSGVWDRGAGGYSCGARISWAMIVEQETQGDACAKVAEQYPQCAQCNPESCTARTTPRPTQPVAPPREAPTAAPDASGGGGEVPVNGDTRCSCATCTPEVWGADTGGNVTCGNRIDWLLSNTNTTEADACSLVAGTDFPDACSLCDPATCNDVEAPTVAPAEIPLEGDTHCSCATCTDEVWDADTGNNVTCGDRIIWLMDNRNETEAGACSLISGSEFPEVCSLCDPATCGESPVAAPTALAPVAAPTAAAPMAAPTPEAPVAAPTPEAPVAAPTPLAPIAAPTPLAPIAAPTAAAPTTAVAPTAPTAPSAGECPAVTSDSALYCFRNASERVGYDSVWGSYRVEVKRDPNNAKCAPNDNRFSEDTVSLSGDDLSLRFKKTSSGWLSSEVRIVLPDNEQYSYGYYEFSVKSVAVKNRTTREVIDYKLPPELVFGMFTFDPRENCQESVDTYYREVDMEISRWGFGGNSTLSSNATAGDGNASALDGMFVVQPPNVAIQTDRFFTGTNQDYDQGGHTYGFYWHPTNLTWQTSAGGGRTFTYTTQQALAAGLPDRIQCLPAPIDVRVNLWNLNSAATDASMELSDDEVVEVVLDRFTYTPSGEAGAVEGDYCSKDCQCADSLICSGGFCAATDDV